MRTISQDTDGLKVWTASAQRSLKALSRGQKAILNRLDDAETSILLQHLRKQEVDGASGRVDEFCQGGTRDIILKQITGFLEGSTSETPHRIFLLAGTAGAGKSTIAHTCRRHFTEKFHLASFFFNRTFVERGAPTKTIGHLAHALASVHPDVGNAMAIAIKKRRDLMSLGPVTQFRELILGPLAPLPPSAKSVVIVIDALDEADDRHSITP
ncbi:hypothetical protein DL93DRAFT_2140520 [Clavulina sp. PMI_390]|nr:hypothetical protein DL93DRAFT_2140520 [Clavulina sp. PMI_390]